MPLYLSLSQIGQCLSEAPNEVGLSFPKEGYDIVFINSEMIPKG